MVYPNIYNKLKAIAELEAHWDDKTYIVQKLLEQGFYSGPSIAHSDRKKVVWDQVEFMKELKAILLSNKTEQKPSD